MKKVFISRPIGGDSIEENIKALKDDLFMIIQMDAEIMPDAPYLQILSVLDDADPQERKKGLLMVKTMLQTNNYDEVWLRGNKITDGMQLEIEAAEEIGLKVVPMSLETRKLYKSYLAKEAAQDPLNQGVVA